MPKAAMKHAFVWTCLECGTENVLRIMLRDAPPSDVRQMMGLKEWEAIPEEFGMSMAYVPGEVMCRHCKTVSEAVQPEGWEDKPSDEDDRN